MPTHCLMKLIAQFDTVIVMLMFDTVILFFMDKVLGREW